jgi:hypothetical protein
MTSMLLGGQQLLLDLDPEREEEDAPHPPLPGYVPTARLAALIDRWLEGGRTLDDLAIRTGISAGTLSAIHRRRRQLTRFRVADEIVTRLDVWLWHTPPEEGGLADLYASPLAATTSSRGTGAAAAPRPLTPRRTDRCLCP